MGAWNDEHLAGFDATAPCDGVGGAQLVDGDVVTLGDHAQRLTRIHGVSGGGYRACFGVGQARAEKSRPEDDSQPPTHPGYITDPARRNPAGQTRGNGARWLSPEQFYKSCHIGALRDEPRCDGALIAARVPANAAKLATSRTFFGFAPLCMRRYPTP